MGLITNSQRTAIFAYAKKLGIKLDRENKNDELYDLIERVSGKRSLSKLSVAEANAVLNKLRASPAPVQKGNGSRWSKYAFGIKPGTGMATEKQLEFIRAMMLELAKRDPADVHLDKRLRGWLEKYTDTSDVRFLTPGKARLVIEGLKAYLTKLGWKYHRL